MLGGTLVATRLDGAGTVPESVALALALGAAVAVDVAEGCGDAVGATEGEGEVVGAGVGPPPPETSGCG